MAAPTPPRNLGLAFREFFRSVTLENPAWVEHTTTLVQKGDRKMIRLLMGYLQVLPPGLRAAVLAARVADVPQASKNAEAAGQSRPVQIREPR